MASRERKTHLLADLDKQKISEKFMPTLERVKREFLDLKETIYDQDRYTWADKALAKLA